MGGSPPLLRANRLLSAIRPRSRRAPRTSSSPPRAATTNIRSPSFSDNAIDDGRRFSSPSWSPSPRRPPAPRRDPHRSRDSGKPSGFGWPSACRRFQCERKSHNARSVPRPSLSASSPVAPSISFSRLRGSVRESDPTASVSWSYGTKSHFRHRRRGRAAGNVGTRRAFPSASGVR